MYERMLECLKREDFVLNLDRYEKVLKERFPEQVRDLYISICIEKQKGSVTETDNRELMKYLKKISGYPAGKKGGRDRGELAGEVLSQESHDG